LAAIDKPEKQQQQQQYVKLVGSYLAFLVWRYKCGVDAVD